MRFAKIILFIFIISATVFSQGLININYQITYPQGETADYIDKVSFRGVGLEWNRFLTKNLAAGISLNWNVFNQVATETADLEDGNVTGTQNRTINSFPFLATAQYFLGNKRSLRPYLGVGAGAYLIKQRLGIGIYTFEESNWHFGVAPEVGVQIPLEYETMIMIAVKYNYAFETKEQSHSYLGLHIGIATDIF